MDDPSKPDASRAVVTGASSGIGRAFAERLARDGAALVLVARRRERLEELADRLGRDHGAVVEVLVADLAGDEGVERVARRLAAEPEVDLLVNDAGTFARGAFHEADPEALDRMVRVNVLAAMRLARAAAGAMAARGRGAIVNVSSRAAFRPEPGLAAYAASKAFVSRLSLALAAEVGERGVRVLAVCPGNVRTELFEKAGIAPEEVARMRMPGPEVVVDASLEALARGERVCVPGEGRRDAALRRALPEGVRRRIAGVLARLSGG